MTRIKHPRIPDTGLDVAASNLDEWLAAGWLLESPPLPPIPDLTPTTQTFPTPGDVFSVSHTLGGPRG